MAIRPASVSRVLVDMRVPPSEVTEFKTFLNRVGHECREETGNPGYERFLG